MLKDLIRRSGAISVKNAKRKPSVVVTTEPVQDNSSIESEEFDKDVLSGKSRTISAFRGYLPCGLRGGVRKLNALTRRLPFPNFVGPDHETTPHNETVIWNLMFLVIFFASLCLAARYPTQGVRIAFVSISGLVFILLSGSVSLDLVNQGRSMRAQPFPKG